MRRRALTAGAVLALLTSGCGLPLSGDVQVPGEVAAEQREEGGLLVLPPGPRPDASAVEVVEGFLAAQSSPDDRHAVARQFLAPGARWDDAAEVKVYEPSTLTVQEVGGPTQVVVTARYTGRVVAGSFVAVPPDEATAAERYTLERRAGSWRLTSVPPGLRLAPADRDRSLRARSVYFLAADFGLTTEDPRLVADPVFVPVTADLPSALVERLLAGPSAPLRGAVETAVPPGTRLTAPVTTRQGVVTVALSEEAQRLPQQDRERLSAQVVWTMRGARQDFLRLRLLSGGTPLRLDGRPDLQDRDDWSEFDPDGLPSGAAAYYVSRGQLRSLDQPPRSSPATEGQLAIDEGAVSAAGQLALVTDRRTVLRIGPSAGPFTVIRRGRRLTSPSWGNGEQGLWVLEDGAVKRALGGRGPLVPVTVVDPPPAPLVALQLSRDGARVAVVAGGRLLVGRVERSADGQVRVGGLRDIAPATSGVVAVTWDTATSLVVLARAGQQPRVPVRVAVDGSTVAPISRAGLVGVPQSLTAATGRPLTLSVREADGRDGVYRDDGRFFQRQAEGSEAFYPG